jgi:hypothetical protein
MATRSRIGIELEDGRIESIYCHFDGYHEGVGKELMDSYTDREKVEKLIALGDISSLCSEVEPTSRRHSFNTPQEGVTVAYHRDRGEDFNPPAIDNSAESFFNTRGYTYLFNKDGVWMTSEESKLEEILLKFN